MLFWKKMEIISCSGSMSLHSVMFSAGSFCELYSFIFRGEKNTSFTLLGPWNHTDKRKKRQINKGRNNLGCIWRRGWDSKSLRHTYDVKQRERIWGFWVRDVSYRKGVRKWAVIEDGILQVRVSQAPRLISGDTFFRLWGYLYKWIFLLFNKRNTYTLFLGI